jgi:PhzF family phenazine biosynthesis protein
MKLPIYQVDAFAEKAFEGNPAAVVPLEEWLPDATMQAIAAENNLAETAFFVKTDNGFHIRWFTPTKEVTLCGHATLASAFVLFNCLGFASGSDEKSSDEASIVFDSLSGELKVSRQGDLLTLDFPNQPPVPCDIPEELVQGLGKRPIACYKFEDYVAVFEHEEDIKAMEPDYSALEQLDLRGVIVTAPASEYDFVARFFAPKYGIPEDPVTGSAYTKLTPYWAERTGKQVLNARQISSRGGNLKCTLKGDRVYIAGKAVLYLSGSIDV